MDVLGHLIRTRASSDPDHPVVTVAGERLTYAQLHTRSDVFAAALDRAGLVPGDHAAVVLPNCPAFLDAWIGMAKAGVVEVPLHTASRSDGLRHALFLTRSRLVVVDALLLDRVAAVAEDLPDLGVVVVVGPPATPPPATVGHARVVALADFTAGVGVAPTPALTPLDTSVVLFTSGTTGPSKGVVMSHRSNFRLARTMSEAASLAEGDVLLTTFPLFHVAARYASTLAAMLVGGRVVIRKRFSAGRFWQECAAEGVTAVHYLGSLLTILLRQPEGPADTAHDVRLAYGAGAPAPVAEAFATRFGMPLFELYGMTETGAVTMNRAGAMRLGSCGRVLPDCEVAIHDTDDEALPTGQVGEIVVRPLQPGIMLDRYVGMPEATLEAVRNLWFHTGDEGRFDDDGYLWFEGRRKDSIRRRGENVSAFEVEVVLDRHPAVAGSAVIGVPDAISGEEVMAWVEPVAGHDLDLTALIDHCAGHLPYFAVPRYMHQVDVLPRNTSQRVEKHRLREQGLPEGTWDREAAGYVLER